MNDETRAFSLGGERPFGFWGGVYCQLSHAIHNLAGDTKLTYLKCVCQIIHAGRPPYNAGYAIFHQETSFHGKIAYPPLHG